MLKFMPQFKSFFFALTGFFAALGALSFSHVGPASAQSPGVNLAALVAQVNALQSTVNSQATTINSLQAKQTGDEQTIASQGKTISTQTSQISVLQQDNAGFKTMLASLNKSVAGLQTLTAPLSLSGTDLTFTGVNVHIVSGSGYTDDGTNGEIDGATLTGLGNLTIGYNVSRSSLGGSDSRVGSHNLILGAANNYSSYGGLVAGQANTITSAYASVSGGYANVASGYESVVGGGFQNTASGIYSSVSGGVESGASGEYASVSGGYNSRAGGYAASVSGGGNVTQSSSYGWSGGTYHSP